MMLTLIKNIKKLITVSKNSELKKGKEIGCKTKNGLEILEIQANESWRIWNY